MHSPSPLTDSALMMLYHVHYFQSVYIERSMRTLFETLHPACLPIVAQWRNLEAELVELFRFDAVPDGSIDKCGQFDAIVRQLEADRLLEDDAAAVQPADVLALRSIAWLRYERMSNLVVLSAKVDPGALQQLTSLEVELWGLTPGYARSTNRPYGLLSALDRTDP